MDKRTRIKTKSQKRLFQLCIVLIMIFFFILMNIVNVPRIVYFYIALFSLIYFIASLIERKYYSNIIDGNKIKQENVDTGNIIDEKQKIIEQLKEQLEFLNKNYEIAKNTNDILIKLIETQKEKTAENPVNEKV